MGTNGSISVVIPSHNHGKFLVEAVASVRAQGTVVREMVVVDDGSTDGTAAVLEALKGPDLRSMRLEGVGPSAARNAGWRAAQGEWVFFLDADDTIAPEALARLLEGAKAAGDRAMPYGYAEVYAEHFDQAPAFVSHLSRRSGSLVRDIAVNFQTTMFVVLFRKTCLEAVGGFDPGVSYGEDFDFALRLVRRNQFVWVDVPVYRIRMHGNNRHRGFGESARDEYCRSARRAFAGSWDPRDWMWSRRAQAHWLWVFAVACRKRGDEAGAREGFRAALKVWPLHRPSWAGFKGLREVLVRLPGS